MLNNKNKMEVVDIMSTSAKSIQFFVQNNEEYNALMAKMPCLAKWIQEMCGGSELPLEIKIFKKQQSLRFLNHSSRSQLYNKISGNCGSSRFRYPTSQYTWIAPVNPDNTHIENIFVNENIKNFLRENPLIVEIASNGSKKYDITASKILIKLHTFNKAEFQKYFDKKEKANQYAQSVQKAINELDTFFKV